MARYGSPNWCKLPFGEWKNLAFGGCENWPLRRSFISPQYRLEFWAPAHRAEVLVRAPRLYFTPAQRLVMEDRLDKSKEC